MSKSIPAAHPIAVSAAKIPRQKARFISARSNRIWRETRRRLRLIRGAERAVGDVHRRAFKHFRIQL